MFTCKSCNKKYSNATADELEGNCECGQALADENGIGWRHLNVGPYNTPHNAKTGEGVTEVVAVPINQKPKQGGNDGEQKEGKQEEQKNA